MSAARALGLIMSLLAGCSAHVATRASTPEPAPTAAAPTSAAPVSRTSGQDEAAKQVDTALSALPNPPQAVAAPAPPATNDLGKDPYAGVINRAGLVSIVDQGLGRFFTHLRLAPVLQGKRFVGFAISGIDAAWGDIGLVPGDVLLKVNGQPIERPEQAMAVFEGLRVANEVAVEFTRAGVPATLRFRIE